MRKLLAFALIAPLAGCAEVKNFEAAYQIAANGVITQNEFDIVHSGYDAAFLVPLAAYAKLGVCGSRTKSNISQPCADRAILVKLRSADKLVQAEFDTVQGMITSGNNTGISAEWNVLQSAIWTAEGIAANNGVK